MASCVASVIVINKVVSVNSPKQKKYPRFITLCGRIFRDTDSSYYPRVEYRGRTILLCTDSCLGAFLSDPDVFYKVHRNSEKHKNVEAR